MAWIESTSKFSFNKFDVNGDGALSTVELNAAFDELCENSKLSKLSDEDRAFLWSQCDENKDGKIVLEEWTKFITNYHDKFQQKGFPHVFFDNDMCVQLSNDNTEASVKRCSGSVLCGKWLAPTATASITIKYKERNQSFSCVPVIGLVRREAHEPLSKKDRVAVWDPAMRKATQGRVAECHDNDEITVAYPKDDDGNKVEERVAMDRVTRNKPKYPWVYSYSVDFDSDPQFTGILESSPSIGLEKNIYEDDKSEPHPLWSVMTLKLHGGKLSFHLHGDEKPAITLPVAKACFTPDERSRLKAAGCYCRIKKKKKKGKKGKKSKASEATEAEATPWGNTEDLAVAFCVRLKFNTRYCPGSAVKIRTEESVDSEEP